MAPEQSAIQRAIEAARKRQAAQKQQEDKLSKLSPIQAAVERRRMQAREEQLAGGIPDTQESAMAALGGMVTSLTEEVMQAPFAEKGRFAPGPVMRELAASAVSGKTFTAEQMRELTQQSQAEMSDRLAGGYVSEFMYGASKAVTGKISATARGMAMPGPDTSAEAFARGAQEAATPKIESVTTNVGSAITQGGLSVGQMAVATYFGVPWLNAVQTFAEGAGSGMMEYEQKYLEGALEGQRAMDPIDKADQYVSAVLEGAIQSATEQFGGHLIMGTVGRFVKKGLPKAISRSSQQGLGRAVWNFTKATARPVIGGAAIEGAEEDIAKIASEQLKPLVTKEKRPDIAVTASGLAREFAYGAIGGFGGTVAAAPTAIIERRDQIAKLNSALRASNTEYENDAVWERIAPAKIASMMSMTPDERVKEIEASREAALQAVQSVVTGRQQIGLLNTELAKAQKELKSAKRQKDAAKISQAEANIATLKTQIQTAEDGVAVLAADAAAANLAYDAAVAFMARNAPQVQLSVDDALREQNATASAARTTADKQAEKELSSLGYQVVFYEGGQEGTDAFYHPMVPNTLFIPSGQASAAKAIAVGFEEALHAIQYADGRLWSELRQQFDEQGVVESAVRYFDQETNPEDITARAALDATISQTTTPARPAEIVTRRYGSALAVSEGTANEIRDGIEVLFRTGQAPGLLGSIIARMGLRGRQAATAFRVRQAIIAAKSTRATTGFSEAGARLVEAKAGVAAREELKQEAIRRMTPAPAPAPTAQPTSAPSTPASTPVSPARTPAPRQGKHAETINAMVGFGFEYLGKESDRWGRGLVYKFRKPESVIAYRAMPDRDGVVTYPIGALRDEVGYQKSRARPVSEARTRTSDIGHKREKATGRYVGAPDWIGSDSAKLRRLRTMLRKLAVEGERGRFWYEKSSKAILDAVDGDIVEAEKLVALIAIYSPTATVPANTSMAFTAYYQWKAGQEIDAGYGASDKKATDLLVNGIRWDGIKTNSFYQNLMVEIDPSAVDPNVATMDMWISLAFDYGSLALDQGPKYKFAEREIQNLAAELGWKPHQVQAAIWTAIKGRIDPIRSALKKRELELGIGEIVQKKDPKTGKIKKSYQIKKGREYEHFRLAHKMGMEYAVQSQDIQTASYDFSNAINDRMVQISWEATPSRASGMPLSGIHKATLKQKIEYANAVQKVLLEGGRDLISDMVGLPQGRTIRGLSAWDTVIGAGFQTFVPVPLEGAGAKREIKPIAEQLLRISSVIRAFVLRQDVIAYHTPMFDGAKSNENGVELRTTRALTAREMDTLYKALIAKFGTSTIAPGFIDRGARILNFEKKLSNIDFQRGVEEVYNALPNSFGGGLIEFGRYRSIGDIVSNNWSKKTNGETYTKIIARKRPDLLPRIKRLQADVDSVNRRFARKYGWDKPVVSAARRRDGGIGGGMAPTQVGALSPLAGAPRINGFTGPDPAIVAVAEQYAAQQGIPFSRQAQYAEVDVDRAKRLAAAYEAMPHNPSDPRVAEAYAELIKQTRAQYDALVAAGYEFYFFDPADDPYADQPGGFGNPYNAVRDLRSNKRMAVYPTDIGFGSGATAIDVTNNPLLVDSGLTWSSGRPGGPQKPVSANDLFRAVHDAFGHSLEGAGFRARGEENAWQAHVRLFTGAAVEAMTTETRGQNSWLNFGPYGETNQTAKVEDTTFGDQKVGVLPSWAWTEGRVPDSPISAARTRTETPEFRAWFGESKVVDSAGQPLVVYHGSQNAALTQFRHGSVAYFTPDRMLADSFAARREGGEPLLPEEVPTTYAVYLALRNPLVISSPEQYETMMQDTVVNRQGLIAQGYDGIVYTPTDGGAPYYAAFYPNQIKSIYNTGTWDSQSSDISRSRTRVQVAATSAPAAFYSSLAKYLLKSTVVSPAQLMKDINKAVEEGVIKRDEVYWSGILNLLPMMEEQGRAVTPRLLTSMLQTFTVHTFGYMGHPQALRDEQERLRKMTRVALSSMDKYRPHFDEQTFLEMQAEYKPGWEVQTLIPGLQAPGGTVLAGEWGAMRPQYGIVMRAKDDSVESQKKMQAAMEQFIELASSNAITPLGMPSLRYPQSDYSLAGGRNAREIVLSLQQGMVDRDTGELLSASESARAVARIDPYSQAVISPKQDARHFHGVKNQIVHIRANDRFILVDGKLLKFLFGEEFQSDWRSAGEEEGFATADPAELSRAENKFNEAKRIANDASQKFNNALYAVASEAVDAAGVPQAFEAFTITPTTNGRNTYRLIDATPEERGVWRWTELLNWRNPAVLERGLQITDRYGNIDTPVDKPSWHREQQILSSDLYRRIEEGLGNPFLTVDIAEDDYNAKQEHINDDYLLEADDRPRSAGQFAELAARHSAVKTMLRFLFYVHHEEFVKALPFAYRPAQLGARSVEEMGQINHFLGKSVTEINDALIAHFFDQTTSAAPEYGQYPTPRIRFSWTLKPKFHIYPASLTKGPSAIDATVKWKEAEAKLEVVREQRNAIRDAMSAVEAGPWVSAPRFDVMTQGQGPETKQGVAPAEVISATFASSQEAQEFAESLKRQLPEGSMVPQQPDERTGLPRPPKERKAKATVSGVSRVQQRMVAQTDQILQLALKQFFLTAVNEGYDGVAFINGRQTAERYRVSKYIVSLSYHQAADDPTIYDIQETLFYPEQNPQGPNAPSGRFMSNTRVGTLKELIPAYGKEIVDQIANGEGAPSDPQVQSKILYHTDLNKPSSGWDYLYETVVPKNVGRFLKDLKAGETRRVQMEVSSRKIEAEVVPDGNGWYVRVNGEAAYLLPSIVDYRGPRIVSERLAREAVATIESWNSISETDTQLAVLITDPVDAAVRKGLSSFARSRKTQQRQESLAYAIGRRSGQVAGMIQGREQGIREGETRQKALELARRRALRAKFAARVAEFEERIERDAERIDGLRDRLQEMRVAAQAGREELMAAARKKVLRAWFAGQQKGANAGFDQAKREMVQMRRDANKIIKMLPPSMRGKYISALAEMRTVSGIDQVAQRVVRDLATADAIDTVNSINAMLKRTKKIGLRNETREEINGLLLSARSLLVTGKRRLLPFTSTADLSNRIASASDLLEQAMTAYDDERGEWREARDLRAMEIEQDSETLSMTLDKQKGLEPAALTSRGPTAGLAARALANLGNIDIYTIMHRLEGGEGGVFGKIWSGLIAGKDRMIKARRALDTRIDAALRNAGYDGYDGYAARAAGLYGDATAETVEVKIGGELRRITVDEMLHLAALDQETVDTLLDMNNIEEGGSPIVFSNNRFATPLPFTKQEHAQLVAGLTGQQRMLVKELKAILEEDVQPTLFEVHFQATGRQPPLVEGYFPRRRLGDEVGSLTEETLDMNPAQAVTTMLQNAGFMQQRVQSRSALVIGGMMRTYDTHLDEALRVIHLSTPLRRAITILRRRSVRANINRILGRDGNDSIRKLVMNGVGLSGKPSGDFVEVLTSNLSGALLTLNPKTWIRQLGGAFRLATEFPLVHWMSGMARTAAMSPTERARIIDQIEADSGYFYERHRRSQVGLFANVIGDPRTGKEQWSNAMRAVGRALRAAGQDAAAMQWARAAEDVRQGTVAISRILRSADFALRAVDRQIMLVAYNAGVSQMQEAGATEDALRIGAAKLAERSFRKTQNISDPLDDTVAGARWKFKQGVGRLMFPFSSDPLKGYNQIRRAVGSGDSTEIAKTSAAIAGNVALSAAVNPIFAAIAFGIKSAFDAGDDDEVIAEMLARREGAGMVRRMATDALATTTGYAGLFAAGIIESATQNPMLAGDAGEPLAIRAIGDFAMAIARSNYGEAAGIAGQAAGIPVTTPAAQIVRNIQAVRPDRNKLIAEYRRIKKERGLTAEQESRLTKLETAARLEKLKTAP